jgi:putative acetyltransferase
MNLVQAQTIGEIEAARTLFREYQQFLGVDWCFQDFETELATLPGRYAPPVDWCFQDFETELATLPGRYAPPKGRLLLALDGEYTAGCVALRPLDNRAYEMKRLFIRPTYRGQGLGRILATRVVNEASALGYAVMRLDTLEGLGDAMRLYESLSFQRRAPYYANPLPGVVCWERALAHPGPAPVNCSSSRWCSETKADSRIGLDG